MIAFWEFFKFKRILFLIIFIFSFVSIQSYSQSVTHIRTDQGLSANDLTVVIKDHNNFMWIASSNGLNKHEGSRIKVYNKVGKDSLSISSGDIHSLFEDRYGFIWIGTTAGLDKLDPNTGLISHIYLKSSNEKSPSVGYILSITQDKYDSLWVSTRVGFFKIDYKTGQFKLVKFKDNSGNEVFVGNTGYKPGITTEKGIWFLTGIGLMFYDYNTYEYYHQHFNPLNKSVFNLYNNSDKEYLSDMCSDKLGNIYFVYKDNKLVKYNYRTEKLDTFNIPFPNDAWKCCYSLLIDNHNNIWIGFRHGGLLIFNQSTKTFTSIINDENNHLLGSNFVYSLTRDYQENIWVATNNGLDVIDYYDKSIKEFTLSHKPDYLDLKYQTGIMYKRDSIVYIPFYTNSISAFNTNTNTSTFYPIDITKNGGIRKVFHDINGNLLAVSQGKVSKIQLDTPSIKITPVKNLIGDLIEKDSARLVWSQIVGNKEIYKTNQGIFYIIKENKLFDRLEGTGWMKQAVVSFDKNYLYYLTNDDNLNKYNLTTKSERNVNIGEEALNIGFAFTLPRDILDDGKGNVWITSQNGLLKYNEKLNKLVSFNTNDNLAHNFTFALALDNLGHVWVSSQGGIDRFEGHQNTFKSFVTFQQNNYMNAFGSSIYGQDSLLYFLAGNKFYKIDPSKISAEKINAFLTLNEFLVNGEITRSDKNVAYKFDYKQNRFEFKFGLLDFENQSKIKYSYYMEGLENGWVDAGHNAEAVYNAMQPGKYIFHVKAKDASGDEVIRQITFPFEITPPFWQSGLFYFNSILLVGGLIFYVVKRREKIQQDKFDILSLKEKIAETKLEALRSQMNPHFIFNSLNAIQECILTNKVDAAYEYLSKFSKLQRMVLNNSAKEFIQLQDEIEMLTLYLSLESLRFSQSFTYTFEIDPSVDFYEILVPSMILQPYIENAIWHGLSNKKGVKKLSINCIDKNGMLVVTIDDNGIGRIKATEKKQQKLGYEYADSKGTSLSAERMNILAIKYKVDISAIYIDKIDENNESLGTTVVISFPSNFISLNLK